MPQGGDWPRRTVTPYCWFLLFTSFWGGGGGGREGLEKEETKKVFLSFLLYFPRWEDRPECQFEL